MANKNKVTPKDYDRWGNTCIKFDDAPKKTPKKAVKTVKKGK